jgi:hypothetical protein
LIKDNIFVKGVIIKDKKVDLDKLDKQMQKDGWKFLGPILHYTKALNDQAVIYEKNSKYVVVGIRKTDDKIFQESISKKEAEKRIKESLIEISKFMLKSSK